MRWAMVILAAYLTGCSVEQAEPNASTANAPQPIRITGNVELANLGFHEYTAPPDHTWISGKQLYAIVKYTNATDRPIWVYGDSKTTPWCGIETYDSRPGKWFGAGGIYGCRMVAMARRIDIGESHTFEAVVTDRCVGHPYRVGLWYGYEPNAVREFVAYSPEWILRDPAAKVQFARR